jgi:hypothetical protein
MLIKLRGFDELKSRIVELHFFAGLTDEEAATAPDIRPSAFDRELRFAKAWLRTAGCTQQL